MRQNYVMGYYSQFPKAIPRSEAGCSRVTHPSATNSEEQAPPRPFDLHVLGVPPAFVLSQDQTLYKVVYTASEDALYRSLVHYDCSQLLICDFLVFSDFTCSPSQFPETANFKGSCLYCSIFKMPFRDLFRSAAVKQLIYYITLFSSCQEVFENFSKFFLTACLRLAYPCFQQVSLSIISHLPMFVKGV